VVVQLVLSVLYIEANPRGSTEPDVDCTCIHFGPTDGLGDLIGAAASTSIRGLYVRLEFDRRDLFNCHVRMLIRRY
jgi:hypothetical protein